MTPRSIAPRAGAALLLASASFVPACTSGGKGSSDSFTVRFTSQSVAGSTPITISGRNLAFLADELTSGPTGTDYNGDNDKVDSIAVAVDMAAHTQSVLNVAAQSMVWIGDELYLVTSEALDGRLWNNDLDMTDTVLLHWSAATPTVTFVDVLAPAGSNKIVAQGTNLFYASAATPVGGMASNIEVISSLTPLVHTPIPTQDMVGPLSLRILTIEEGLIFLVMDETDPVNARNLNGPVDVDATDTAVLALLDGTDALGVIRNTGLAIPAAGTPVRARRTSASSHDWQVGFLVSEAAQGDTNLDDPVMLGGGWQAPQCIGHSDSDHTDNVLHYLPFASWNTNPVTSPIRNTGLVGRDKIAIASGFIATISQESDEGMCDLNMDGDTSDKVVRWTEMVPGANPIVPLNDASDIHALFDCPGGTHGLAEISGHFAIVVNEAGDNLDINGGGLTMNLIGWLLPSSVPHDWQFLHSSGNTTFVGVSWMSEQRDRSLLDVALEERVNGVNINVHNPPVAGEDTDTLDSVPTFGQFSAGTLTFPGVAIAVQGNNAGIAVSKNTLFYRVSEAEDSRDWNGDGDETDFVIFRTSVTQGTSFSMGTANSLSRTAIEFDQEATPSGAAFITDETKLGAAGTDINGDGAKRLIVQYFTY